MALLACHCQSLPEEGEWRHGAPLRAALLTPRFRIATRQDALRHVLKDLEQTAARAGDPSRHTK